jgi:hypothetical protein
MHVHFTYHSQTQRIVHAIPFLWLICPSGWLIYTSDGTSELARIGALLAFGWLFLANFSMNALVRRWGPRLGPIDLSKNAAPTSAEKLLNWLSLGTAVAAGVVTALISVQGLMPRLELKILVGGIVFLAVAGLIDGTLTLAVIVLSGFRIRPVRG